MQWGQYVGPREYGRGGKIEAHTYTYSHTYRNIHMGTHIYILGGGIWCGGSAKGNGRTGGAAGGYSGGHRRISSHSSRETYSQYFCWMARYVVCGVCVQCGVWCVVGVCIVVCGVWCAVWCVVCGV